MINPIIKTYDVDDFDLSQPIEEDVSDMKAKASKNGIAYHAGARDSALETIFKKAKDTILGKTKAGKVLHGVGIALIGVFTGINIEPLTQTLNQPTTMDFFTDFNIYGVVASLIAIALGYLKTKTGDKLDAVIDDANHGVQLYAKFKAKESDGGREVTDAEKDQLLDYFAEIFKKQARKI